MKKCRIAAAFIAYAILIVLAGCSNRKYESTRSFEFSFYPYEYEEEYSTVFKQLELSVSQEYQLYIEAECESGTMEICIAEENGEIKQLSIDSKQSVHEALVIPQNINTLYIEISIDPQTLGVFFADLQAK